MSLKNIKIGFALTGSFCTFEKTIEQMENLVKLGAEVIPIMSYNSYTLDTKFGNALEHINKIKEITGKEIIHTIQEAEPIGPKKITDIMLIAPCSGNTIAKLANGITFYYRNFRKSFRKRTIAAYYIMNIRNNSGRILIVLELSRILRNITY